MKDLRNNSYIITLLQLIRVELNNAVEDLALVFLC